MSFRIGSKDFEKNYNSKNGLVILNPMKDRFLSKEAIKSDKIIISFLGRLAVSKGIIELIQAFIIYKNHNKKSRMILNIAGSGNCELEINKLIINQPDIFYIGALQYNEVDEYLKNTHFTIIPSKVDALNMVGIESLMNKTPLLISNTTGLSHYLKDGEECFKFDATVESITLLLKRVEDNFGNQQQMALNARETFSEIFTMEKYCLNFSKEILK